MSVGVDKTVLMGRVVRIENVDDDFLNVVDVSTGQRFWLELGSLKIVTQARVNPENEDGVESDPDYSTGQNS